LVLRLAAPRSNRAFDLILRGIHARGKTLLAEEQLSRVNARRLALRTIDSPVRVSRQPLIVASA
jgi:hypothetical protein